MFKPLEAFSFGTERQFRFEGRNQSSEEDYNPYFIRSNFYPEQTTIFGALRYLLLKQNDLIKQGFNYSKEERQKMAEVVGETSFRLQGSPQSFGWLHGISPIFILKNGKEIIIPNPFNNKEPQASFSPMSLDRTVQTSHGLLELPMREDYKAKEGYGNGFYNITSSCKEEQIFKTDILTGNRKARTEDALFKREVHYMNPDYSFAVYVTLQHGELKNDYVTLGQKSSLFQVFVQEKEDSLQTSVAQHFSKHTPKGLVWNYALSDIYVTNQLQYNRFAIIEEKMVRQLLTNWEAKNHLKGINRHNRDILLYKAGSVFYGEVGQKGPHSTDIAGYNTIIKIKGEKAV
nr:hypothetical protein [Streptococcus sp. zg-70]